MTALRQRIRQSAEVGATAAEYAGVIIAAAILVLALIVAATPIGDRIACEVGSAIDKITGGEGYACEPATATNNQYEVDPSEVSKTSNERSQSTSAGVGGKVGPGDLTVSGTDGVTATQTENYDGSGTRAVRTSQGIDVEYSVKTDKGDKGSENKDPNPFGAELEASGAIGLSQTEEKTWNCGGDDERSCEDFDEANEDAIQDQLNKNGFGRIGNHGREIDEEPDSVSNSKSAKLTVEAGAGISNGRSVGISGEIGYTFTDKVVKDGDGEGDDRRETSHQFSYKGELSRGGAQTSEVFGLEKNGSASYAGKYKVTYDENGRLKAITFTSVAEGSQSASAKGAAKNGDKNGITASASGKETVTSTVTTTLDVASLSDADRKIAEEYVSSSLTNGALLVSESVLNPSTPSDDAFENLLYEQGKVTRIITEGTTITDSGGIDAWVLKYEETEQTTSTETKSVEVLGEPGSDGTRAYKESDLP
ncbi:YD repeat-containing protein [Actinomyces ruminicola]|uniref:YD repeat-containing protein n=1 Tax=Actinomyces ruminicola TaxID=332524 RepID=A0A1H0A7K2_9ACTO|nr:hypothetical protein [Actinomyces ruminicola]SDN29598.1 YD repeat-containing protein [Actinomyces ruminicola]